MNTKIQGLLVTFGLLVTTQTQLLAQGTAFTYQGRLNNTGLPANGSYDFTFTLFATNSGGPVMAGPVTNAATVVSNGLFTAIANLGPVFTGSSNWLEIAVRTNGSGAFNTLSPRDQVTPVPYAISAESVSGGISAAQLTSGVVSTNVLAGFQGPFYSSVNGGVGNVAYGQYDVVDGGQGNSVQSAYGFVGGGYDNSAGAGGYYATVGGGQNNNASGQGATVPGGYLNTASGNYSFAAGELAQATNQGAFVWSDTLGGPFHSSVNNSFNVRAGGGVFFATGGVGMELDGAPALTIASAPLGITLQQNSYGAPNVIEGSQANYVAPGVIGAVIGGGGSTNYYGFATSNSVAGYFDCIGGGNGNSIKSFSPNSFIGGGAGNIIYGDEDDYGFSVIVAGFGNVISNNAWASFIGGGVANTIYGDADDSGNSVISGGNFSTIWSNAPFSTIGGGNDNEIYGDTYATGGGVIGGGVGNIIGTNSYESVISGGDDNFVNIFSQYATIGGGTGNQVGGEYATVPGGEDNFAYGIGSFAAGQNAEALQPGTFVWADSQTGVLASTAQNQFLIRAGGGVGIGTNDPQAQLHVSSGGGSTDPQVRIDQTTSGDYARLRMVNGNSGLWDIAVGGGSPNTMNFFVSPPNGAGGTNILILKPSGNATLWGTLAQGSDRAHKENIRPVDPEMVLAKLADIPITKWNYITEQGVQHLGPMAQDFYAAFKLGEDDKHITTVDEGGVALAAIQGLDQKMQEQSAQLNTQAAEMKDKDAEIQALKQAVDELAGRVQAMNQKANGSVK